MSQGRRVSKAEDRLEAISTSIVDAFRDGTVPSALAKIFIHQDVDVPSQSWSCTNRVIGIKRGHVYAAGTKQWNAMGRRVKKGERAFYILAPRIVTVKEDEEGEPLDEESRILVGFRPVAVFGYLQTRGTPLPGAEKEAAFIDGLPLIEVARVWNLTVETFSLADDPTRAGVAVLGSGIGIGVKNLSTWAHELVHQADHRAGNISEDSYSNEVVATLGASTLLEALGLEDESDRGFAYEYLKKHSRGKGRNMLSECSGLIERTCQAVSLLLSEADQLKERERRVS